jgi:glycosyltransferase involved in cell wall biosynthesis
MTRRSEGSRLRVLYVDASIGFGGAVKSLGLTLRDLPDVEKQVLTTQEPDIVATWMAGVAVRSFRRVMNYRNVQRVRNRVARLPSLVGWTVMKVLAAADVATTAWNTVRLRRLFRRTDIELVHLNNGFLPLEVFRAARAEGIPCVVHLRDFGGDARRANVPAVVAVAPHVIAISQAVASSLEGTSVTPDRVTIIHDPVDLEAMDRAAPSRDRVRHQWGIREDQVVFGIFGRVIAWKGQREFTEAAVQALSSEPSMVALIVGDESDGERRYLDDIRARIDASGVSDRFFITGYQAAVEDYYAAVDVVVHYSTIPEPFGMVVPEGMAAGKPVIAADAGGPREVVTPGTDGLLVPPGDVAALAVAMLSLAGDPDLRRTMGEAGRVKARERFGITPQAAAVRAVYDAVLYRTPGEARLPPDAATGNDVKAGAWTA